MFIVIFDWPVDLFLASIKKSLQSFEELQGFFIEAYWNEFIRIFLMLMQPQRRQRLQNYQP